MKSGKVGIKRLAKVGQRPADPVPAAPTRGHTSYIPGLGLGYGTSSPGTTSPKLGDAASHPKNAGRIGIPGI